ncbi:helix-turn-helix domain-containing protein [Acrocarpospora catenulata]|uniref:helix-turn-helix domain-containing protein n=1 Tax=Acrocarpospora catenulata TaxID=2836182 RepID=UPI001BD99E65|nr:helix-turn-helix transcriptional regulator [Acrocarpospora catenulata]
MAYVETPAPRRRRLAQELRRIREATEMTGEEAARRVGWSAAKVSRIETAKTFPSEDDIVTLANLYGVGGVVLGDVLKLRKDATQKGWWEKYNAALDQGYMAYLGLEAEAIVMRNWESTIVPGLLQTEGYIKALLGKVLHPVNQIPPIWSHHRVEARLERQRRHLYGPEPVTLHAIIDEATLRRTVGGPRIMLEQLQHLEAVSERPNVKLRIITERTQSPVPTGPFVHFTFRDFPDTVYLEDLIGGRFVEDAEDVFYYERAFEHLTEVALDEPRSRLLIRDTMAYWQT